MVHDGVGDQAHFKNVFDRALCLLRELKEQLIQGITDGISHLSSPLGMHHDVGNPAHQIFPKTNLRIHDACRGKYCASIEITQVCRHGCRPNVHSDTPRLIVESGPDTDDGLLIMQGDGHAPFSFDKGPLQGR